MKVKVSLIGKILGYKRHVWPSQDIHLKIICLSNIGKTHVIIYLKPFNIFNIKLIEFQEEGQTEANHLRGYITGLSYQANNITTLLS